MSITKLKKMFYTEYTDSGKITSVTVILFCESSTFSVNKPALIDGVDNGWIETK